MILRMTLLRRDGPSPRGVSIASRDLSFLFPLQFATETQADMLSLNHSGLSCSADKNQFPSNSQGALDLQDLSDQQLLNNQNQNFSGGDGRHNVPNIILTGQ